MTKRQRAAAKRLSERRLALAMFDLSGETSRRLAVTKVPRREPGRRASDWNMIGNDLRKAIDRIDSATGTARGR